MRATPSRFSFVHYAMVGLNVHQYCVMSTVQGQTVQIQTDPDGLKLRTSPCGFAALVEFNASPSALPLGMCDSRNWQVGFVQTMTAGAIVYEYRNDRGLVVQAAIGPERLPCRDGDGQGVFYDQSALGRQTFGEPDADAQLGRPAEIAMFLDSPDVKYVYMDDSPGTGQRIDRLRCAENGDRRAVSNKDYNLGWEDPLDPRVEAGAATLRRAKGALHFKTWLAMYYVPVRRMYYLHEFEWVARFEVDVFGRSARFAGPNGAELIRETAVPANITEPILTGPNANDSVCVKFLPVY